MLPMGSVLAEKCWCFVCVHFAHTHTHTFIRMSGLELAASAHIMFVWQQIFG